MADTVRAIIVNKGKLLVVTAHDAGYYWLPGGTVEPNESDIDALRRELKEELRINLHSQDVYGQSKLDDRTVAVFKVECNGEMEVDNEITHYTWVTGALEVKLGDRFKDTIFADLLADGSVYSS